MNSTKYELTISSARAEEYRRETVRRLAKYLENHGATCEEADNGLLLHVSWVGDVEMRRLAEVAINRFLRGYGEIVE